MYFDLGDEFYLGSLFRLRVKSGKVEKIKVGFSYIDRSEVFSGRKFDYLNLELLLNIKKNFIFNSNISLIPFLGMGL